MKFGIYSIKDTATNTYSAPFYSQNDNVARRQFSDLSQDNQTLINKHPSDFCLVKIGLWDDDQGTVENLENETLAWAGDFHEPTS